MDCSEEIDSLKKAFRSKKGIQELSFDILNAKMVVIYDSQKTTTQDILETVASTGMKADPWTDQLEKTQMSFWEKRGRSILVASSAVFILIGFLFHPSFDESQMPFISKAFYLSATLLATAFVLPKAWSALRRLRADMNLLMTTAIIGAVAIGELFEAASVSFLFASALLLESWSINRARQAISALMDLSPPTAHVILSQGETVEKKIEDIPLGSRILIRPGERIPLDAIVEKGSSTVNQAPITGESIPTAKNIGDTIYAGTINEEGALECQVTKKANDTTLARIIHMVQEAQSRRAESEQWVDRFASVYTPLMIVLTILFITVPPLFFLQPWMPWIYRGLVLLVIACPCALVISTPVSIVSGLTAAARNGILIKGGMYLEEASHLQAIAMDKTGTLTIGHPEVQKVIPLEGYTEQEILEKATALEKSSEHPLAKAILRRAQELNIKAERADNFQIIKGKGAEAQINGEYFWIGSHRFMHEKMQENEHIHKIVSELEDAGHSIIALGNQKHVIGLISVADSPRPLIRETIDSLRELGIEKIVMLTGDNKQTAQALAKITGVDEYFSELLPEDKVKVLENLKKTWSHIAMIGDGVNDAPAMATASLGIAMGGIGTDVAIETSDVTLMSDDISKLPWLIAHARRTIQIIKMNIGFSIGLKALFLLLNIFGLATLWMAITADMGASLLVVFNGLRLLKVKNE
ncbi:MAG: heavy metal translocating P-type ATPase [Rhabdochlamydiaceae bacterium]|nr:heavy metal translocating P-type ATPase [Rhabdochlamydiaceae bacterium]